MSAGVVPVVTSIPSFRAIAGDDACWAPGDADDCSRALVRACSGDLQARRRAVRERFARVLSWEAIGARTVNEYRALAPA